MTEGKSGLRIKVPEQRKPQKGDFDTRADAVERWVAELPLANAGETARRVYGALYQTNRILLPWKVRYRLLEQLRPPVSFILDSLQGRIRDIPLPLPTKARRIADLARTINEEMALGYKSAMVTMMARSRLFHDRRALTVMTHRTLRYLGRVLLLHYQIYAPHPDNCWLELHRLYRFAAHKRLERTTVTDKEQSSGRKTTIAAAYTQLLLLALATPYRLRQGEITRVYGALEKWSTHTRLLPYDPAANPEEPLFLVALDSDLEPEHLTFARVSCSEQPCLLLDTAPLLRVVRERAHTQERGRSGRGEPALAPDLLRRLAIAWDVPPQRDHVRRDAEKMVELVFGLSALHHAIHLVTTLHAPPGGGSHGGDGLFNHRSRYSARVLPSESDTKEDVWELFKPHAAPQPKAEAKEPEQPRNSAIRPQQWLVRDESDGGYRLARAGEPTSGVRVGELLGVRTEGAPEWQIAVIRWVRHAGEAALEVGVQIIGRRGEPAGVLHLEKGEPTGEFQRAIGLPELTQWQQPASLLLPAMLFEKGDELLLRADLSEYHLQLEEMLENTGAFARFRFTILDKPADTPAPTAAAAPEHHFGNLWSDL